MLLSLPGESDAPSQDRTFGRCPRCATSAYQCSLDESRSSAQNSSQAEERELPHSESLFAWPSSIPRLPMLQGSAWSLRATLQRIRSRRSMHRTEDEEVKRR